MQTTLEQLQLAYDAALARYNNATSDYAEELITRKQFVAARIAALEAEAQLEIGRVLLWDIAAPDQTERTE